MPATCTCPTFAHVTLRIVLRSSQLCAFGVVSRSGWAVVDDTVRPRFDSDAEWPWVLDPPSLPATLDNVTAMRLDWYVWCRHGAVSTNEYSST